MPVAMQENHEKLILDGQSLVQDLNQGPVANPDSKCCNVYHSARSDLQIRICHCQGHLEYDQESQPIYHYIQSQTVELSAKNNCLLWRLYSPRTQDHIVW